MSDILIKRVSKRFNLVFSERLGGYVMMLRTECGARAKSTGKPCRIKETYQNGRCRYHGGLSTGPKTKAGKIKSAKNGFKKGWRNTVRVET